MFLRDAGRADLYSGLVDVVRELRAAESRAKEEARGHAVLASTVASIASELLAAMPDEVAPRIDAGLEQLAGFFEVDRAVLVSFDRPTGLVTRERIWRAPGAPVPSGGDAPFAVGHFGLTLDILLSGKPLSVPDSEALPPEAAPARALLEAAGLRSLFAVAVSDRTDVRKFLVFADSAQVRAWPRWTADLIRTAGASMMHALARAEATRALAHSEGTLRLITENATELLLLLDIPSKRVVYVNPAYETMFGLPRATIYADSRSWLQNVHPDDRAIFTGVVPVTLDVEYRIVRADGTIRWVRARTIPIRRASSEPDTLLCFVSDVSATKESEAWMQSQRDVLERRVSQRTRELAESNGRLREEATRRDEAVIALHASEARFRVLAEGTPAAVLLVQGSVFAYASPAACRLAEMEEAALLAAPVRSVLRVKEGEIEGLLAAVTAGSAPLRTVLELVGARARPARLDATLSTVRVGDQESVMITAVDITSRSDAEMDALVRWRRISGHMRRGALVELSSGLAHELNQPLTAVVNFVEGALMRLEAGDDGPAVQSALVDAAAQARRAASIVRRLRALFSQQAPQWQVVAANELLARAASLLALDVEREAIQLEVQVTPPDLTLTADTLQIELVLVNLLRNAVECFRDRAWMPRRIVVRARAASGGVEIVVHDTGPPVAAEVRGRLFESFLTTRSDGSGTGLFLASAVVRSHEGRIWLEDTADGKSFIFLLPTRPEVTR